MPFQFFVYNHSNDGVTVALRAHQDVIRLLVASCTGTDENVPGRTLADYIQDADAATTRPESFFRNVDIVWNHPTIALPTRYSTDRRFRVTYSGNVRLSGGIAFEGYCVVDPAWYGLLMPLVQTPIQVEYFTGTQRDLLMVVA